MEYARNAEKKFTAFGVKQSDSQHKNMKRRTFIKTIIATGIGGCIGGWQALAGIHTAKKILYALKIKKYPGKIKPLGKLTSGKDLLG